MKKVTIKFLVIRLHKVYFDIYPVEYPKKMAMINQRRGHGAPVPSLSNNAMWWLPSSRQDSRRNRGASVDLYIYNINIY
jgi:hypothetical protein